MRRWGIGFLVVLLACIPIFLNRGQSRALLEDTDTAVLLTTIRQKNQPFSWFFGDWPLKNHFYRPLPTLVFELDSRLYGNNPEGYGVTNALLAIGCVLLLFWFFRELTDKPALSTLASCLFACWISGSYADSAFCLLVYAFWAASLLAIFLTSKALLLPSIKSGFWTFGAKIPQPAEPFKADWRPARTAIMSALVLWYAAQELSAGMVSNVVFLFPTSMIQWLPSRTASVMTVFALASMAAYTRYERTGSERQKPEPTPLDPPATKGTRPNSGGRAAWLWAVFSVFAAAGAFASYEQAVMLPAVLVGIAILMRMQGYKVRWSWQIAFWLLLVAYLILRKEILPPGISRYEHQQTRFGPAVWYAIMGYVFPSIGPLVQTCQAMTVGVGVLLTADLYTSVFLFFSNIAAFIAVRKHLVFALAGWALSVITFLPMAWVKPFSWYHFWPMAMRSIFTVTVCWTGFELLLTAVTPQALQAPPRLDPAPGSLPRP